MFHTGSRVKHLINRVASDLEEYNIFDSFQLCVQLFHLPYAFNKIILYTI